MLGVNSRAKRGVMQHYISDSIYRLTLAWVTSENSTKQLECRLILTRSSSLSLDPISCWLASLLRCPESTALVRVPSPTLSSSFFHSLLASCYHFRIRRDFMSKNPLSGFVPKQTKESSAWRATHIVLHIMRISNFVWKEILLIKYYN